MEKNVGGLDRTARLVIGAILVLAAIAIYTGYLALGAIAALVAVVVGAILLITGATQQCPINRAIGRDTLHR